MRSSSNFIKSNIVSCIAIAASVVGFLLQVIGAFAFCGTTDVGLNLRILENGMVIAGFVLVVLSLAASLEELIRAKAVRRTTLPPSSRSRPPARCSLPRCCSSPFSRRGI